MARVPKLIKAVLDFSKMLPEQLLAFGQAVWTGLNGNVNFPGPPIDLNVFRARLDAYSDAIGQARDGGKKAITLRNRLGEEVIRMLRALALYVEINCKDDTNTFLTSGFHPRTSTRMAAQPLDQPTVLGIDQGITGELLVWIKSVGRSAKSYDVRYGALGAGGTMSAEWLTETIPNAKTAARINGLTPGTTYAIQVRAYGPQGHTPWSDSSVRMCI